MDVRIGQVWRERESGAEMIIVEVDTDGGVARYAAHSMGSAGTSTVWIGINTITHHYELLSSPVSKTKCDMGCDAGRGYRPGPHSHDCAMAGVATVRQIPRR